MLRELDAALQDNNASYPHQIHNVVRTHIRDKILASRTIDEMIALFSRVRTCLRLSTGVRSGQTIRHASRHETPQRGRY